ncbi:MAG: MaoC family dehydratase N-terminal domain-containing protein [Candidatus Dormibacteraeota bacterium]|nr:MaoC family dehydratase N-terminal domain-containing protein [Candidatus Dormibacteraeota bacterium]MBV9525419.1 MaoC family dehydratase N-terminal domain-containing protein [Candidatus Dormibacteraeota bacterium]
MSTAAGSAVKVGDELEPLTRVVSQEQINAYAEASGDFNPIHVDEEFARSVGLPGTIAHGLLELGILAEAVARWAGTSDALLALECRFSKPLRAGDAITCTGRVAAVDDAEGVATLDVEATSDRGERVLTNGRARVRLSR